MLTNRALDFLEKLSRRFAARLEAIQGSEGAKGLPREIPRGGCPTNDGQAFVELIGDATSDGLVTGLNSTSGVYIATLGTAWSEVRRRTA